jgi:hypothetical protein
MDQSVARVALGDSSKNTRVISGISKPVSVTAIMFTNSQKPVLIDTFTQYL